MSPCPFFVTWQITSSYFCCCCCCCWSNDGTLKQNYRSEFKKLQYFLISINFHNLKRIMEWYKSSISCIAWRNFMRKWVKLHTWHAIRKQNIEDILVIKETESALCLLSCNCVITAASQTVSTLKTMGIYGLRVITRMNSDSIKQFAMEMCLLIDSNWILNYLLQETCF